MPPTPTPFPPLRTTGLLALGLFFSAGLARAQQPTPTIAPAPTSPLLAQPKGSYSGRDFAGLRLPLQAVTGSAQFSAQRVWTWTEGEPATGGEVYRLYLVGDVSVRLGLYEFAAARASVWMERIDDETDASGQGGGGTYQIFIYFDRVGNPKGPAGISIAADRLPVRAVLKVPTSPAFKADLLQQGRPREEFIGESERALADSLQRLATGQPQNDRPSFVPPSRSPEPPRTVDPATAKPYRTMSDLDLSASSGDIAGAVSRMPFAEDNAPIFVRDGIITIAAGNITYLGSTPTTPAPPDGPAPVSEAAVLATGGVVAQYSDPRSGRGLQFQAQRAVIFLVKAAAQDPTRVPIENVAGIFLEGDVTATDGRYSVRGPRVYYDVQNNKAVLFDAVFWTYDEQRHLPLYVRADVLRQQSQQEFKAERAHFSTSSFFDPEFSLGAAAITISRKPVEVPLEEAGGLQPTRADLILAGGPAEEGFAAPGTVTRTKAVVDATDVTLRFAGLPLFYFPHFQGDPSDVPLKDVRLDSGKANGPTVKTRWNLTSLLGLGKTDQVQHDLLLHYYTERGPAVGLDSAWKLDGSIGKLFAYTVIEDQGTDLLKPGTTREHDSDTRGILLAEQTWTLDDNWSLFAEASLISDETFVDAFFERMGEERREFASQMFLRYADENSFMGVQIKGSFNDFIANEYLLQSRGYSVAKLPELSYIRHADEILEESMFGPVSWWQEYRVGEMAMQFDEVYARERGFDTVALSQQAFGINPDQTIAQRLRAAGYTERPITRVDTRQEFSAHHEWGPFYFEPFAVLRATAYDNDFADYSPAEPDNARLWGSAGVRAGTRIERIDDSVDSRFFDLHRLRHIIEPSVTFWSAGTNVQRVSLPEYDYQVEGISEGSAARIGVAQTWQTMRGDTTANAPGARTHSVDVFKLNTDLVFTSDDADRRSPLPRWTEFRPELSSPGNYFQLDGLWQATSALAFTASDAFDFDTSQQARTSAGVLLQHEPGYTSFMELRYLNPLDSTYLDFGTSYTLTAKYSFSALASYDLANGGFQGIGAELRRSFSAFTLGFSVSYNNVTDETGIGFVLRPTAFQRQRVRILDSEPEPGPVLPFAER